MKGNEHGKGREERSECLSEWEEKGRCSLKRGRKKLRHQRTERKGGAGKDKNLEREIK